MIVDTSAIVAIVLGEPRAEALKEALARSIDSRMAAPTYVELCAVMQRRGRPEITGLVDRLLRAYDVRLESFDGQHAAVAARAYRDYGRGSGHAAGLNLADTYSYALAQVSDHDLLFVGDGFVHTDVRPALR